MKTKEEAQAELSQITEQYREKIGARTREEHAERAGVSLSVIHFLRDGLTRSKDEIPSRADIERAIDVFELTPQMRRYIDEKLLDTLYSANDSGNP